MDKVGYNDVFRQPALLTPSLETQYLRSRSSISQADISYII